MRYVKKIICGYGETADAPGLGPGGRNPVGVQIPLPALYNFIKFGNIECMTIQQKEIIITEQLAVKKEGLKQESLKHKSIIFEILDNPDIRDQFILKLTYNSNRIEGSTLTEPDTAAILFDNVALSNKSLSEQFEAKNHQTALNYLFDCVVKKEKISENLILKFHSILMNGVRSDAGLYRNHAVRIVGVNLPTANFMSVPKLMSEIIDLANKKSDDIIALSASAHSVFEKIHPFSDGNGRVGRLIMNFMLLRANFAPAIIRQEQKRAYYAYLYKAQTNGDHSQLEDFFCGAISDGFKILDRKDVEQ